MKKILVLVAFLSAIFGASYNLDAAHSNVSFEIKHMKISKVKGNFKDFSGVLDFDENTQKLTKLEGIIKINSIDTNNIDRDAHLKAPDYFDEMKFPEMKFVAKSFNDDKINGDLTIKGITKPVTFEYDFGGINKDKIGFSLETKIYRTDFNIGQSSAMLDDKVEIEIEIEAKKI